MEEGGKGEPGGAASRQHSAACPLPVSFLWLWELDVAHTPSVGKHSQKGQLGGHQGAGMVVALRRTIPSQQGSPPGLCFPTCWQSWGEFSFGYFYWPLLWIFPLRPKIAPRTAGKRLETPRTVGKVTGVGVGLKGWNWWPLMGLRTKQHEGASLPPTLLFPV